MDSVLLINDMPGFGKVALPAMIPILSGMRYQIYNLPTALISNTLDYGKFDILETTEYMRRSMEIWDGLGFRFDAICTGFLASEAQAALVADYCARKKGEGVFLFVDPIMGDAGRLYNGVPLRMVENMRRMCRIADMMVPNATEAAFLAGKHTGKMDLSQGEAEDLLWTLHGMGAKSIAITSMRIEGQPCILLLDGADKSVIKFPYAEAPVRVPGAGDIFSALVMGCHGRGMGLAESVQAAMDTIGQLIRRNQDNAGKYKGIPTEQFMEIITQWTSQSPESR